MQVHAKICKKVFQEKTKVFDSKKQREIADNNKLKILKSNKIQVKDVKDPKEKKPENMPK